jgi:hypothetical protein
MAAKGIGDEREPVGGTSNGAADGSTTRITFTECRIGKCQRSPLEERSLCAVHEPVTCNALTINGYPCHQPIDQCAPEIRLCTRHGAKFTGLHHQRPRLPRSYLTTGHERRDPRARWS